MRTFYIGFSAFVIAAAFSITSGACAHAAGKGTRGVPALSGANQTLEIPSAAVPATGPAAQAPPLAGAVSAPGDASEANSGSSAASNNSHWSEPSPSSGSQVKPNTPTNKGTDYAGVGEYMSQDEHALSTMPAIIPPVTLTPPRPVPGTAYSYSYGSLGTPSYGAFGPLSTPRYGLPMAPVGAPSMFAPGLTPYGFAPAQSPWGGSSFFTPPTAHGMIFSRPR